MKVIQITAESIQGLVAWPAPQATLSERDSSTGGASDRKSRPNTDMGSIPQCHSEFFFQLAFSADSLGGHAAPICC